MWTISLKIGPEDCICRLWPHMRTELRVVKFPRPDSSPVARDKGGIWGSRPRVFKTNPRSLPRPEPVFVCLSGPSSCETVDMIYDHRKTRPWGWILQALAIPKARASYKGSSGTGILSGRPETGRSLRKPAAMMVWEALALAIARACDFNEEPSSSWIVPNEDDRGETWLWGDELWTLALMKARIFKWMFWWDESMLSKLVQSKHSFKNWIKNYRMYSKIKK